MSAAVTAQSSFYSSTMVWLSQLAISMSWSLSSLLWLSPPPLRCIYEPIRIEIVSMSPNLAWRYCLLLGSLVNRSRRYVDSRLVFGVLIRRFPCEFPQSTDLGPFETIDHVVVLVEIFYLRLRSHLSHSTNSTILIVFRLIVSKMLIELV